MSSPTLSPVQILVSLNFRTVHIVQILYSNIMIYHPRKITMYIPAPLYLTNFCFVTASKGQVPKTWMALNVTLSEIVNWEHCFQTNDIRPANSFIQFTIFTVLQVCMKCYTKMNDKGFQFRGHSFTLKHFAYNIHSVNFLLFAFL